MRRRQLLALGLSLPLAARNAFAEGSRYRVALADGGLHDGRRFAGLVVDLDDGWKTYWRMPGEAGIPPDFNWSASRNVQAIKVLYPLPHRLANASGETVGYEHKVVFPVMVTPVDDAQPVDLALDLFFAVCKDICIPAKAKALLTLTPQGSPGGMVADWIRQVPAVATAPLPVSASTLALESGKPVLLLSLSRPVDDIFVESQTPAYFRKPVFSADGFSARLEIDNVSGNVKLSGEVLKLTLSQAGTGLEQTVTLD